MIVVYRFCRDIEKSKLLDFYIEIIEWRGRESIEIYFFLSI